MTGLQQLQLVLNSLRPFLAKGSISEAHLKQIKFTLDSIPFFSSPIFNLGFDEVQRVTINKRLFGGEHKRIDQINLLKYPPAHLVSKYGRANFDKQSVFYAAFDSMTVLDELKPEAGDLITISKWEMKPEQKLNVSPIFKITTKDNVSHNAFSMNFLVGYENSLRKVPKEVAEQIDALIQFMAECFAKEVDNANHLDYFLSAYFTNRIFHEFENGEIEAIVYPSVQKNLSFSNIVMKPESFEKKYTLKEVDESVVKVTPKQNGMGYFLEGTAWSKQFDYEKGTIIWKQN